MGKLTNLGTNVPEQLHVPEMPEPRKRGKKRMKVKELLELLKEPVGIEICENNIFVCNTYSDKKGIEPYMERKINSWQLHKWGEKAISIDILEEPKED